MFLKKMLARTVVLFFLIFVLSVALLFFLNKEIHKPLEFFEEDIVLEVNKGANSEQIFQLLKKYNIVHSRLKYNFLIFVKGSEYIPKYGQYLIPKNSSLNSILDIFNSGKSIEYKITIPEGLTTKKIIEIVSKNEILKGSINNEFAKNEGYFLPETYFFSLGYSRNSLLERMKKELIDIIDFEWNKRDNSLPYKSKYEALVIASLIESEASLDQERRLIASVFVNRIRKNMRLQSDPTVKYGLEKLHKLKIKTIKKSHLKIDHPWNTYTRNGLPVTPICNPGKSSIIAALNPLNSDYLYFVADKKGGHFFAKNLREHNKNINYLKRNTLSKLNDNSSIFFSDNDLPLSKPLDN